MKHKLTNNNHAQKNIAERVHGTYSSFFVVRAKLAPKIIWRTVFNKFMELFLKKSL